MYVATGTMAQPSRTQVAAFAGAMLALGATDRRGGGAAAVHFVWSLPQVGGVHVWGAVRVFFYCWVNVLRPKA